MWKTHSQKIKNRNSQIGSLTPWSIWAAVNLTPPQSFIPGFGALNMTMVFEKRLRNMVQYSRGALGQILARLLYSPIDGKRS